MKRASRSKPISPPLAVTPAPLVEQLPAVFTAGLTSLAVLAPLLPFDTNAEQWNNVLPLMLWILLVAMWALAGVARGSLIVRCDATTIAVLVLTFLPAVSAVVLVTQESGNARLAANLAWQWIGFGLVFFFARQVLKNAADARALVAVLLAVAAGLSAFALMQVAVLMPAARAAYHADPERVILEAGIDAPPGTPKRQHFEDRLQDNEPSATFALTNSLAGFLTPWLVLALGVMVGHVARRAPLGQQWLWWLLFVLLLLVLVLTKSRTALLATVGGASLAIWYLSPLGKRLDVRIPLAVGAVLIACLIGGVATGLLDTKVLSEAPKSLLYRVQYWQSTAAMIAERPWLGCGPGNFQDTYLRYQLPEASENISDPHNFVLEIWANFGTLALVALLAVMGLFAWQVWNGAKRITTADDTEPSPAPTASYRLICAAALVGVIMAYGCGFLAGYMPDVNLLISGVPVAALVLWLLRPWVASGELNITKLVPALAALVVNLLVAGGIGAPGVATSLWLLLALILTLVDVRTNRQPRQLARPLAGLVLVAVGIGGLLYHRTVYDPVLRSSALLSDAQLASERGRLDDTIRLLTEAAAIDPYSPTPPLHLASLWKNRLLLAEDSTTAERTKFADACAVALERDPRSHSLWQELGIWHLELYLRHQQPDDLTTAIDYFLGAIERYPSQSIGYAQLAWVRHLAGQGALAAEAAREALDLDSRHEHKEYKLQARRLFEIQSQPPLPWPAGTAEQVMQGLRTASDSADKK